MNSVNTMVVLIFHLLLMMTNNLQMVSGRAQEGANVEICEREMFKADCGRNSVIVMTSARYGRMRLGRCIMRDYGFVGCSHDAIHILDRLCSGKKSCDVPSPHTVLRNLRACPKDLLSYLEASYICLRVAESSPSCQQQGFTLLEEEKGAISSTTQSECPWKIQSSPGQRINITMLSFASAPTCNTSSCPCHKVGTIIDITGSHTILCVDDTKEKNVYLSVGSSVTITLSRPGPDDLITPFILQYKVTGCADLEIQPGMTFQRDRNSATVFCLATRESWHLLCVGNKWIGSVGSCSPAPGCSDPEVPPGMAVKRERNNATVFCIATQESWHLRCRGNKWVGDVGSCSAATGCTDPEVPPGMTLERNGNYAQISSQVRCESWFLHCKGNQWVCAIGSCSKACSDPDIPSGMTLKRQGDNAGIFCTATGESWFLHCMDNQWVGTVGSCSADAGNK